MLRKPLKPDRGLHPDPSAIKEEAADFRNASRVEARLCLGSLGLPFQPLPGELSY